MTYICLQTPVRYMENAMVGAYLDSLNPSEREALGAIRGMLLHLGLREDLKWGRPVYSRDGINLIGFAVFKSYLGLWFFQGALLQDQFRVLVNAQEGKTQSMRQWRFSGPEELNLKLKQIKEYVVETLQKAQRPEKKKPNDAIHESGPDTVFERFLEDRPELRKIFDALAPSHRREYVRYYNEAKRPVIRANRLEKMAMALLNKQF